jgi:serine/threonine protein kinase
VGLSPPTQRQTISYSYDPEKGRLVWNEEIQCDKCRETFPNDEALVKHDLQRCLDNETAAISQSLQSAEEISQKEDVTRLPRVGVDIISHRSRVETVFNPLVPESSHFVIGLDVQASSAMGGPLFNRRAKEAMPKPSRHGYIDIEPSFSGEFSSGSLGLSPRNGPPSILALQHRKEVDEVSLRSYKSAESSLVSYFTARSDSDSRWGTSVTRQSKEGEGLDTLSENICVVEEVKRGLSRTQKEFEALVDIVSSCVIGDFEASNVDQVMLRETIRNCLRGQHLTAPRSGGIPVLPHHRDDDNSMKQSTATDDRVQSEIGAFDQLKEPLDKLMGIVAGYRSGQSNTEASKFADQKLRRRLGAQLCVYIDQYHTGAPLQSVTSPGPVFSSEWLKHLHQRGILLEPEHELNWSGRGQHVEYGLHEKPYIPLQLKSTLGHGATAVVESVQCLRILLVRKTIKCSRRLIKEDVVVEVEHLQRLQHSHIVRTVGTYTLGRKLSILLYPAADKNLEDFMDDMADSGSMPQDRDNQYMQQFFGCLSNAIDFIHNMNVKHMDIKPRNILVRQTKNGLKVYIADFGIAKAYSSAVEAFTDSPTSCTRKYAAPEVIMQDTRGFPADIFSLGCVFLEMVVSMGSIPMLKAQALAEVRGSEYHTHIEGVRCWYLNCLEDCFKQNSAHQWWLNDLCNLLLRLSPMLDRSPEERPLSSELKEGTVTLSCQECDKGPEPFEATNTAAI